MDKFNFIAQLIGYVGLLSSFIAFQCKKHRNLMIFKTGNEVLFAIQYLMLASYTGMAMNTISSVRNIIFAYLVSKNKSTLPFQIAFSVLFIVFGIITWNDIISLAVITAKIITTVIYGIKNTRVARFATIPVSSFWLIYNIQCSSQAGVLCEVFSLVSVISAIIRIDIIEKRKNAR
ncbi:MAG: YgjV family protein [Clostridia bacterium]|nr:YgjV family protein [Clostridia bacterium]